MSNTNKKAIAIVGIGAIMPDAGDAKTFWQNIKNGKYSISEVRKERWDVDKYYDPDPKAPAKSYSKIGGWIHNFEWDPIKWKMPIPPKVSEMMDFTQKWAIICTREALMDYGYPNRPLNPERTAVIMGNAMGGDLHLYSASRILYPEIESQLVKAQSFTQLSSTLKDKIIEDLRTNVNNHFAPITEDTMPGELSNIVAGRIAALWDFKGPNYIADAACASAMAGMSAAIEGLANNYYDAVISGGIDANMSASSYIKFCKIGALSATGTRPYSDGADGFVMGEGGAIFLLKRLTDAERDGDKIYAIIRGVGGSSDGKGKGITAPNPRGQVLAIKNAWENAGLSPKTASLIEGHGTSTKVGDAAELSALADVFNPYNLNPGSIALGSVKSNLGHLKGAAGAAGIFKAVMALNEKVIPPSLHFNKPNPNIDFSKTPFYVNTVLRPWELNGHELRRAGVSAFGFGGTNFHTVLEEYIPGRIQQEIDREEKTTVSLGAIPSTGTALKTPLQGALLIGGSTEEEVLNTLKTILKNAQAGQAPPPATPKKVDLQAFVRLAIDYQDAAELVDKAERAIKILETGQTSRWRALQGKGVFFAKGPKSKVAFLFPGQGSQYVNMLKELSLHEEVVGQTFKEADAVMKPLLGKPLTDYIFVSDKEESLAKAEEHLKQTEITQPAVLTINTALSRLLAEYGIEPDMVMGHSLGEYSALISAGILSFENALVGVSARGTEMARVSVKDNGLMAAVLGSLEDINNILSTIKGYVVIANINSTKQAVIGGETKAIKEAVKAFLDAGINAQIIPVSHAFHTKIIAAASAPIKRVLTQMGVHAPKIPIISNVTGDFYPRQNPKIKEEIIELLSQQIASPVQFVKGLNKLYDAGIRTFIEVGPKRTLNGFVQDVLGDKDDILALSTNLPKNGDTVSFNRALCGLYAAGLGHGSEQPAQSEPKQAAINSAKQPAAPAPFAKPAEARIKMTEHSKDINRPAQAGADKYQQLGHLFADFLDKGMSIYSGEPTTQVLKDVCITGAALGLPGTEKVFDDGNLARLLQGEQFIKPIINKLRHEMAEKNITRLVKSDTGGPRFETINNPDYVIKLAGRSNLKDLVEDFGYPEDRLSALDSATILAIAAGLDAMRDAGIPLVKSYKTTTKGTQLPDRWILPEDMRDETGIIFASAFPGLDSFAEEMRRFYTHQQKEKTLDELKKLRDRLLKANGNSMNALDEIDKRIQSIEDEIHREPYNFDRRFLLRVLSMGHAQFAEYIGARGPNTQINSACASTTQAVSIANDWIQAGRCNRVIVISADDITTDNLMGWFGAGFLATGAAATDELVENAAIPFDRRRHGMIIGMGAAALVVEDKTSALQRGISPIADVLATKTANSAFHGTRLDVDHIKYVMEDLVSEAESRWGIDRYQLAPQTVFVSHETYTPARGGSASAEINALRYVFGPTADQIVIANTKGLTGHAMAAGIEDVLAVKTIETGIVPPIANFKEIDPELGVLNLSKGGHYPIHYALRLGAGFGSQISLSLIRWNPAADGEHRAPGDLGYTYRITDHNIWNGWMKTISGYNLPELEVVKRTLRVKDQGPTKASFSTEPLQREHPNIITAEPVQPDPVNLKQSPVPQIPVIISEDIDPVQKKVMQLISEQTGYPPDMLDMELDLEADLGIDTVKQAEMFASVRQEYNIERDDNLQLREYNTLASVVQFVYDKRPDLKENVAKQFSDKKNIEKTIPALQVSVAGNMDAANTIPRRIPTPVLRPDLALCKNTGVKLSKGSRVIIMPDRGGVYEALVTNLKKRNVDILLIEGAPSQQELEATIKSWLDAGEIHGVYWLAALDQEKDINKMNLDEWHQATHTRVKLLFQTMRTLYQNIGGAGTFLVTATHLGGQHGYDKEGALAPLGGAVSGFSKSYKREKPDCLVKVVDFGKIQQPELAADILLNETLMDTGAVEIGYKNNARWTISLAQQNNPGEGKGLELNTKSVFLVTGAAGSIVSAITSDLAQASSGIFYLIDLIPEPDLNDPDLQRFSNDKENLKKDIFQRLKDRGQKATPVIVEKEMTQLERSHSALTAIQAIEQAGGSAYYYSLNLLDNNSVAKVIQDIKEKHGKIDVLLHAGGLEISKTLADKEPAEFDLVFDVKSDGWFNLLSSIGDMPLASAVVFSSIAGRFGNAGQTDYSSANDLLCKSISSFRTKRRGTRGLSLDWTAWGGIGMAVRGSIPTIMKQAGIEMLPPEAGIPIIRRELTSGDNRGEFVVAKSLGLMVSEFDENGGLDNRKIPIKNLIMTENVLSWGLYNGLTIQTDIDPKKQPFLYDHQINQTAVLPGVMGIEAMTETAMQLFPDMHIKAVKDVHFSAPFKFYKNEPRTVTINAIFTKEEEDIVADCKLTGTRKLHGQSDEQITVHFTAKVLIQKSALKPAHGKAPNKSVKKKVTAADIYKLYFHGPAYQVIDSSWRTGKDIISSLNTKLGENHVPASKKTIVMPRLIELCFQTAGIMEMSTMSRMGLPSKIEQLIVYKSISKENKPLTAIVNEAQHGIYDAKIVDNTGLLYLEIKGYQTMQLPDPIDENLLKLLTIIN